MPRVLDRFQLVTEVDTIAAQRDRVTVKEVARQAGVSPSTVSRVVNRSGYVSAEAQVRVREAIANLNYRPNAVARSLRRDRSQTVGVIFPDISNPFFMAVGKGLEERLGPLGYCLLFGSSEETVEEEVRYLRALLERRVDGIVLASCADDPGLLRQEIPDGHPLVLVDRRIGVGYADLVKDDDQVGARLATEYLIAQGHRRIATITGPRSVSTARDRVAGFRQVMSEQGLAVPEPWVLWSNYRVDGGYASAETLLGGEGERPTALFVGNNLLTAGVLVWLREHGWSVPEDLSIVSHADLEFGDLMDPPLTVVRHNAKEIGLVAADLLIRRLEAGHASVPQREVVLIPELVVRGSVACPRPGPIATAQKPPTMNPRRSAPLAGR